MKNQPLMGYLNTQLLPTSDIHIPVYDLLILRGLGAFDYMRTYNRQPFLMEAHVNRFIQSAHLLNLELPATQSDLIQRIRHLAEISPLEESSFRLILTAGFGANSMTPGTGSVIILTEPIVDYPPEFYQSGVHATFMDYTRYLPAAKSITYSQAVIELKKAKENGYQEIIYTQGDAVTEGTTCNLFMVKNNQLYTAKSDMLFGTRRNFIIELMKTDQPVTETHLLSADVREADELFVTSTMREVLPVTKLEGQPVGDGLVGPATKKVMERFKLATG